MKKKLMILCFITLNSSAMQKIKMPKKEIIRSRLDKPAFSVIENKPLLLEKIADKEMDPLEAVQHVKAALAIHI